jgi:hypothetical protein
MITNKRNNDFCCYKTKDRQQKDLTNVFRCYHQNKVLAMQKVNHLEDSSTQTQNQLNQNKH